jgi:hypothetical protein
MIGIKVVEHEPNIGLEEKRRGDAAPKRTTGLRSPCVVEGRKRG